MATFEGRFTDASGLRIAVVVAGDLQGRGLGRRVVEALLEAPTLQEVERVYLMTTNSAGFYQQLGFSDAQPQQLLIRRRQTSG